MKGGKKRLKILEMLRGGASEETIVRGTGASESYVAAIVGKYKKQTQPAIDIDESALVSDAVVVDERFQEDFSENFTGLSAKISSVESAGGESGVVGSTQPPPSPVKSRPGLLCRLTNFGFRIGNKIVAKRRGADMLLLNLELTTDEAAEIEGYNYLIEGLLPESEITDWCLLAVTVLSMWWARSKILDDAYGKNPPLGESENAEN